MDKSRNIEKMNEILNDTSKFKEINANEKVFTEKEDQRNLKLLELRKEEKSARKLRSTGCQPFNLYRLRKTRKFDKDLPLRPILSMMNSYCENIGDFLLSILALLSPSQYSVKDTLGKSLC